MSDDKDNRIPLMSYVGDVKDAEFGFMPFTIRKTNEREPWEIVSEIDCDTHDTLDELLFWNLIIGGRCISENMRAQILQDFGETHDAAQNPSIPPSEIETRSDVELSPEQIADIRARADTAIKLWQEGNASHVAAVAIYDVPALLAHIESLTRTSPTATKMVEACNYCKGTGEIAANSSPNMLTCPACNGERWLATDASEPAGIRERAGRRRKAHSRLIHLAARLIMQRSHEENDPIDEEFRLCAIEAREIADIIADEFRPCGEVDVPVCKCGLPLSKNPHPQAGDPLEFVDVGATYECIPCLAASRHGWAMRAQVAELARAELELLHGELPEAEAKTEAPQILHGMEEPANIYERGEGNFVWGERIGEKERRFHVCDAECSTNYRPRTGVADRRADHKD